MKKSDINTMITYMKKGGIVTKATPWMVEGKGDRSLDVRYVGITLPEDWDDIIPRNNNILLKFVREKAYSTLEIYLANAPPFLKVTDMRLSEKDTWETLLGAWKQRMRKDKEAAVHHTAAVGNLYQKIKPYLK